MTLLGCPVADAGPMDLEQAIKQCEPLLLALIRSRMDRILAACTRPEDILQDALLKGVRYRAQHPPSSPSAIEKWLRQKVLDCLLDRRDYILTEGRNAIRTQPLPGGSSDQGGSQLAAST